ncbi:hypothetical protein [Alcaligenes aquatilis]|uniref:Uncharacterized protein n=1 Tax=Alcaligenes aquatilis TaxID=323284 RepID=A0A3G2HRA4_9BURK|nr:hypothetical protein [Alcaligenes aquatilis]AYN19535.1 hypothetical protein D3M96_02675 [Alcaligenes aquatilis]
MSAQFIMITEIDVTSGKTQEVVEKWRSITPAEDVLQRVFYRSTDDETVLEIVALESLNVQGSLLSYFDTTTEAVRDFLKSDFRRQLLSFVEAPRNTDGLLPSTQFLQLRHVEVLPPMYKAYRHWREETIFDVVRSAEVIELFLAYHSAISTEPGVMFLSGFNGDVDSYMKVFNSDRYKDIVQQAGNQYITGGEKGLYTRLYQLIS